MEAKKWIVFAFIFGLAMFRLIPQEPNFTPILAMALMAGLFFKDKKYAILAPLAVMALSDLFLGFHASMPFVYGSLVLISLVARVQPSDRPWTAMGLGSVISAVLFFIITNFGVWAVTGLYPLTFDGLVSAYTMALPFFRNTLISTLLYGYSALAVWTLLESRLPSLQKA